MSQSKFCVITMQFGFAGALSSADGFYNIGIFHTRSHQFNLDLDTSISDQIFSKLNKMTLEAGRYHDSLSPESKEFGHIFSHSAVITDGTCNQSQVPSVMS